MIRPERALVRPCVRPCGGGSPVPLEDAVRAIIVSGAPGRVTIIGGPGAGKTTALRHLAATIPSDANVELDNAVRQGLEPTMASIRIELNGRSRPHRPDVGAAGVGLGRPDLASDRPPDARGQRSRRKGEQLRGQGHPGIRRQLGRRCRDQRGRGASGRRFVGEHR